MGGGRKKSKKKKKSYSRAQQMARKRLGLSSPGEGTSTGGNNSGTSGIGPVSSGDSYASSLGNQRVTSKGPSFSVGMNNNLGITSKSIKTSTPKGTSSQFSRGTTGVGPVASGAKYASMLKQSPPRFSSGTMAQQKAALASGDNTLLASHDKPLFKSVPARLDEPASPKYIEGMLQKNLIPSSPSNVYGVGTDLAYGDNLGSKLGIAIGSGIVGGALGIKNKVQEAAENLRRINEQKMEGLGDQSSLTTPTFGLTASTTPMAIQTYGTGGVTEDASSESGYSKDGRPLTKTEAMSAFGIGGLNLDNSGGTERAVFSGSNPNTSDRSRESFNFGPTVDRFGRGDNYARNINEFGMRFGDTSEARADAYNNTLTGRKNLFDNATSGSGPVASGDAYARGLETSRFGSPMNAAKTVLNAIPGVNFRLQNDKELADSVGRAPTLARRGGSGGSKPLAAVPTIIEELLPQAMPVASASTTPTTQTGVDPNRLLQIQQQAYQQAYNPMSIGGFNPQFRFASRAPRIDYSTYFNYS